LRKPPLTRAEIDARKNKRKRIWKERGAKGRLIIPENDDVIEGLAKYTGEAVEAIEAMDDLERAKIAYDIVTDQAG